MAKDLARADRIALSIRTVRGQRVLLDSDLAALYGVTTTALNQAVKRNAARSRSISHSDSTSRSPPT